MILLIIFLVAVASLVEGQPRKCDQTPLDAADVPPSDIQTPPLYTLEVYTKADSKEKYLPDQTYVLILKATNPLRPFKKFMITAEDPSLDNLTSYYDVREADVGNLKTLDDDLKSRYSYRCPNSVENNDNSDKNRIEMHWVSPKDTNGAQRIRFRAMVAENNEVWYDSLQVVLDKDDAAPVDQPPYKEHDKCNLTSEARYEIIFKGKWSRGSHSLQFPTKPHDLMYSHMVGASHGYSYTLWARGADATPGLKALTEEANITVMERDIINNMSLTNGTRTLIRGKMLKHPHMSEPSHALFRVDSQHHLFSIAVALKPSPDWFLGTSRFELCSDDGWLDKWELRLYPWDAGIRDGINYETRGPLTEPPDKVDRVAVGSFNKQSPFYQLNLNDLKPFALLEVKRLDVYPREETGETEPEPEKEDDAAEDEEENEEPSAAESLMRCDGEWSQWSSCTPFDGHCGVGKQTRSRALDKNVNFYNTYNSGDLQVQPLEHCQLEYQTQSCYKDCFD